MRGNIFLDTRNYFVEKEIKDKGFNYVLLGQGQGNTETASKEAAISLE
jgi:hypothetical protein